MIKPPITTPILFLIFNRPDITGKVFNEIRKAKPKKLFVAADGPRKGIAIEADQSRAARDIIKQVDWDCEVQTLFRTENLGCKLAVSSAIDWFFKKVDSGIILEDDCLPNQSFFWFCQELLEKYKNDERIMQISGNNYLFGKKISNDSYYFSKLNDISGWATWKRAWQLCDFKMKNYLAFKKQKKIYDYISDRKIANWLMNYLEEAYQLRDTSKGIWSNHWSYAMAVNNGLTIVPAVNLVFHLGFKKGATHYHKNFDLYNKAKLEEINELIHPQFILPNRKADELRFKIIHQTDPSFSLLNRFNKIINRLIARIIN